MPVGALDAQSMLNVNEISDPTGDTDGLVNSKNLAAAGAGGGKAKGGKIKGKAKAKKGAQAPKTGGATSEEVAMVDAWGNPVKSQEKVYSGLD